MVFNFISISDLNGRQSADQFHPKLYNGCDCLFILGLNLIHVLSRTDVFILCGGVRQVSNCVWHLLRSLLNFFSTMRNGSSSHTLLGM